jgi:hypothetical protein
METMATEHERREPCHAYKLTSDKWKKNTQVERKIMLIEPRGGNLVFIRGTPANPDWKEPENHPMFLEETSKGWNISICAHRITISKDGFLFINGEAYKKPEKKRVKTRKTADHYVR